jgi:hypothetical protein
MRGSCARVNSPVRVSGLLQERQEGSFLPFSFPEGFCAINEPHEWAETVVHRAENPLDNHDSIGLQDTAYMTTAPSGEILARSSSLMEARSSRLPAFTAIIARPIASRL